MDPLLPIAHLRPERGWTNDPTGPVRWQGRTHLFHQHHPDGAWWARPRWGHLVTDDLVRWRRLPTALEPGADGPDHDGCFSGTVAVDGDRAIMAYTGVVGEVGPDLQQTTCLATSDDPLLEAWTKLAANPVIEAPDAELHGFRDPFLWHEDGRWWQLIGSGSATDGGQVRRYSSTDLHTWTDHGVLLSAADLATVAPGEWVGDMWECPALLRGPDGDALILSLHDDGSSTEHPIAVVGELTAEGFLPGGVHRLDLGPDLYAPCLLQEPDGTAISWAWSWEACSPERAIERGWAGVLTAPRRLSVVGDRVLIAPLDQLAGLRTAPLTVRRRATERGWVAEGTAAGSLDVELHLDERVERVELHLGGTATTEERTTLILDRSRHEIWLDRDQASADPTAQGGRHGGALADGRGPDRVRVLIDRSIVEVFVDDTTALTARIYPTGAGYRDLEVVGPEDQVVGVGLQAWRLGPIWEAE